MLNDNAAIRIVASLLSQRRIMIKIRLRHFRCFKWYFMFWENLRLNVFSVPRQSNRPLYCFFRVPKNRALAIRTIRRNARVLCNVSIDDSRIKDMRWPSSRKASESELIVWRMCVGWRNKCPKSMVNSRVPLRRLSKLAKWVYTQWRVWTIYYFQHRT